MNGECENVIWPIIKYVSEIVLLIIGGFVAYIFGVRAGRQLRRKKSIHDVADVFAKEAGAWAEHTFDVSSTFTNWHRRSVYRLASHADYVEQCYPKQWNKVKPFWDFYRCYPNGIQPAAYIDKKRNDFVRALYKIADALREA